MKAHENTESQADHATPGQTGWLKDSTGRNASGVCPQCGGENSLASGGDAVRSKPPAFKCSHCDWQEYPEVATESTNRHGLV